VACRVRAGTARACDSCNGRRPHPQHPQHGEGIFDASAPSSILPPSVTNSIRIPVDPRPSRLLPLPAQPPRKRLGHSSPASFPQLCTHPFPPILLLLLLLAAFLGTAAARVRRPGAAKESFVFVVVVVVIADEAREQCYYQWKIAPVRVPVPGTLCQCAPSPSSTPPSSSSSS
jgi:hypothetical protein